MCLTVYLVSLLAFHTAVTVTLSAGTLVAHVHSTKSYPLLLVALFGISASNFHVHGDTADHPFGSYVTVYSFLSYLTSTTVLSSHLIICCVISLAVNHATVLETACV